MNNDDNCKASSRIVSDMQYARIIEILSQGPHVSREEDNHLTDEIMLLKDKNKN